MVLKVSASRALKDALAFPAKEPFERCLGQSVRRHGGTYEDYVELMSLVRETARRRKIAVREAARILAGQP